MERTRLGRSEIEVSAWCLGTMTWGRQTPEADAHAQIERALDHGIDFLDTAEMYPVNPPRAETVGDTETIIGNWLGRTGRRDEVVIATKCLGPSALARDGAKVTGARMRAALEASLRRLRVETVDLYQLHWPNRGTYAFRQNWGYDPSGQDTAEVADHMAEMADTLARFRDEGKIRTFGLSNETCWGTMRWLAALEAAGAPRVEALQNEVSLLCRLYDTDLAEMSHHEGVTCLAFSPLAAGLLTGKYQGGALPDGSRMAINGDLGGRRTERAFEAAGAHLAVAEAHGLDPVAMALAWVRARPYPAIPIFGATTVEQLDRILAGTELRLSPEVMADLDAAHRAHPMPY